MPERSSMLDRKRPNCVRMAPSSPEMGSSESTVILPVVIVPVLSRHSTSARESVSMPYSSCTRVFRLPSLITPTAKATEISRISPSGIMPIMAATDVGTAVVSGRCWRKNCLQNKSSPIGISAALTMRIRRLTSVISTDFGRRISFAERVRRAA